MGDAREDLIIRPKTLIVRLPISQRSRRRDEIKSLATDLQTLHARGGHDHQRLLDDETTVQLLGHEFDCEITIDTTEEKRIRITDKTIKEEIEETDPEKLDIALPSSPSWDTSTTVKLA